MRKSTPYWLAIGADGRVWFTELSGAKIGVVDPASGRVTEVPTPNGERAAGITVDATGRVWAGTLDGSLLRIDPSTDAIEEIKAPGGSVYGVAAQGSETVWVGTTATIAYSFDIASGQFHPYAASPGAGPWWPTIGPQGQVWIALGSPSGNALARVP